jgi:ubiquinone/menaquinone biosynthesis C-methylase UbiE
VNNAATLCAPFADVFFLQADLLDLPFPRSSFDLVYSIRVFHRTPDSPMAFREIARRVKTRRTPAV